MSSEKMKEIIERLKKQSSPKVEPKQEVEVEDEELDVEEEEEVAEPVKKATKEAVKEKVTTGKSEANLEVNTKLEEINNRIAQLQNDGVFRLNLLIELGELNNTLRVLTATIMKVGGVEEETSNTDKK